MCLFQFWFPQGIRLGVGLLGHMVLLFLAFKGISIPSYLVAVSVYIPTVCKNSARSVASSVRTFPFLRTLSSIIVCRLFDDGHSDWREMVPHSGFDLHFSDNE